MKHGVDPAGKLVRRFGHRHDHEVSRTGERANLRVVGSRREPADAASFSHELGHASGGLSRHLERRLWRVMAGLPPRRPCGFAGVAGVAGRIRGPLDRSAHGRLEVVAGEWSRPENPRGRDGAIDHRRLDPATTRPPVEDQVDAVAESCEHMVGSRRRHGLGAVGARGSQRHAGLGDQPPRERMVWAPQGHRRTTRRDDVGNPRTAGHDDGHRPGPEPCRNRIGCRRPGPRERPGHRDVGHVNDQRV